MVNADSDAFLLGCVRQYMRIVLARHGRPESVVPDRVAPREMGQWIDAYSCAGVVSEEIPSRTIEAARSSGIVVASTSPRSTQSAQSVSPARTFLVEPVFCEAGLPYAAWQAPRLRASTWAACFRLAWFFGYSANAESIEHAKARAEAAARRLAGLAEEHGSVFLIGHGIMTGLIARRLRLGGWFGPAIPARRFWRFS